MGMRQTCPHILTPTNDASCALVALDSALKSCPQDPATHSHDHHRARCHGGCRDTAVASADDGVSVCNEAENSPRGGYVVTGGLVDPNPPAFLRGSQMRVGNGNANGLENAAEHSPALRLCGPEEGDGGGDGDPDPT
jgi:hypothetical protein